MDWFNGIVVFVLIWWSCLFTVLPWGVRHNAETSAESGHCTGAPVNPNLKKKFIITTIMAFVIWCVVATMIAFDVVDFYDLSVKMFAEDYK